MLLEGTHSLPFDFLTNRRTKRLKLTEQVTLLPFSDEYHEELMEWLNEDEEKQAIKEFLYGCKTNNKSLGILGKSKNLSQIDEEVKKILCGSADTSTRDQFLPSISSYKLSKPNNNIAQYSMALRNLFYKYQLCSHNYKPFRI
jgi:hypothetical protein